MIQVFTIGDTYPIETRPGTSGYFGEQGFIFTLELDNISTDEIEYFKFGELTISFCKVTDRVSFFVIDIENFIFTDVAFTIIKTPCGSKGLVTSENDFVNTILITLVDAKTHKLIAMRQLGISSDMSKKIYEVCKKQEEFDFIGYEEEVVDIQNMHSTEDLVDKFTVASFTFPRK